MELPKLAGSEKQVAWATEIRNSNIKCLEREIEELKDRKERGTGSFPELIAKLENGLKEIKTTVIPAKWWIENQGMALAFIQKAKRG